MLSLPGPETGGSYGDVGNPDHWSKLAGSNNDGKISHFLGKIPLMIFWGIQQGAPLEPMGILKWDSYKQGLRWSRCLNGNGSCPGVCRRISRISDKIPHSVGAPCLWEIFILARSHLKCRTELYQCSIMKYSKICNKIPRSNGAPLFWERP
jgi:hypothetical protein